jgi:hypothetical protein
MMRKVKTVWVHIMPRFEEEHGMENGADCWCEPIVETTFDINPAPGSKGDIARIALCVHQHDMFTTEIVFGGKENWKLHQPDQFNTEVDLGWKKPEEEEDEEDDA